MTEINKFPFVQEDFPHINLEDAIITRSKRLFPLCNLKLSGQCITDNRLQNPTIVGGNYYWETKPPKPCAKCGYHRNNCWLEDNCPANFVK